MSHNHIFRGSSSAPYLTTDTEDRQFPEASARPVVRGLVLEEFGSHCRSIVAEQFLLWPRNLPQSLVPLF